MKQAATPKGDPSDPGRVELPSDVRSDIGLRLYAVQYLADDRTRPDRHGKGPLDAGVAVLVDIPNIWHMATRELSYYGPQTIEDTASGFGQVRAKLAFGPREDADPLAFGYAAKDFAGWDLIERPRTWKTEKDVDTLIVANMVELSHHPGIDTLVLVSGDLDMLPGLNAAQNNRKDVVVVGWKGSCSWALSEAADELVLVGDGVDRSPSPGQLIEYDRQRREIERTRGNSPLGRSIVIVRLGSRLYRDELRKQGQLRERDGNVVLGK